MRLPVSLAVGGALLVFGGVALISVPLALVVAGAESIIGAYTVAYAKVRAA